jgi:hypothetical protein
MRPPTPAMALALFSGKVVVTEYRRVQKSVANHVIGPPGPSQFHSFVPIAPTLYDNSTSLWIWLLLLSLNLVGVNSIPLDPRYSNSARCAGRNLPTNQ